MRLSEQQQQQKTKNKLKANRPFARSGTLFAYIPK